MKMIEFFKVTPKEEKFLFWLFVGAAAGYFIFMAGLAIRLMGLMGC